MKLFDKAAVDMIHPDLATSGGLIETKKIGDYARARRRDGHALCRIADLLHGERPLRRRDRELPRARTSFARRAVVGKLVRTRRESPWSRRVLRSCPIRQGSAST